MNYHRQDDWLPLCGEAVQIRNNGHIIREGSVDAVTVDGSMLWIAADGANQRQLVNVAEGDEVWITYKWDTTSAGL